MSVLHGTKLREIRKGQMAFFCPACKTSHFVIVDGTRGWSWNGDGNAPTFSPSILVRTGHYAPNHEGLCWCGMEDKSHGFSCFQCHSYVEDGKIRYLNDCSHNLAGQTVPLPDW